MHVLIDVQESPNPTLQAPQWDSAEEMEVVKMRLMESREPDRLVRFIFFATDLHRFSQIGRMFCFYLCPSVAKNELSLEPRASMSSG